MDRRVANLYRMFIGFYKNMLTNDIKKGTDIPILMEVAQNIVKELIREKLGGGNG